jgi:diguanylate cyclase (GGDEF)-like protein
MFNIIYLTAISVLWFLLLKEVYSDHLKKQEIDCLSLEKELNRLRDFKQGLATEQEILNKKFEDILALYELTKDVCLSLDEEKVFSIFNKNLKRYISIGDCRYIKNNADLAKYEGYLILPLKLEGDRITGYLAVDRIVEEDKVKFGILVQQFMIALRRALLYQKVQGLTITDMLTGIYCRRYFLERFSEELKRSKKNKLALTFLMIDIDNFKHFNDRYGHLVGDAILRQVSKTVREAVRQIDFIGRYGGEEISVVLAETSKEQANFAAERIRHAISGQVIKVYDEQLKVTVSIGGSTFPENSSNIKGLIEMADQALYLAKETGKNKVCFSPD